MNEHSHRYQDLAEYLNGVGYDVYVLDAVGQGLNAPKVEDQEKWYKGAFDDNVMFSIRICSMTPTAFIRSTPLGS